MFLNIEKLIFEVKKRECIWNRTSPDNNNVQVRRAKWEEIGKVLYPDWDSCSSHEKDARVQLMAKKWRNVRDYYLKEKRIQKREKCINSDKIKKKREYNYFRILRFLDKCTNNNYKSTEINENQDSINYLGNESDCSNSQEFITQTQAISEDIEIEVKPETPPTKRSRLESATSFQTRLLTCTIGPENESYSTAVRDFLLSLMPDVESLTSQQYMEFRLGVLNLLNNIIFNDSTNANWVISPLENTAELNK